MHSGFIQGLGLGLIFVPLSTVTSRPSRPSLAHRGHRVFSLMRNIGSSIGISIS